MTYDPTSKKYSTLAGNNTSWTKTGYFYEVDGEHYPVYAYAYYYYYYYRYYVGYSKDGGATITTVVEYKKR